MIFITKYNTVLFERGVMRFTRFPLLLFALLLSAATLYCGEGGAFSEQDRLAAYFEKPSGKAVRAKSTPRPDAVFCRQGVPVEKDFSVRHAAKKKLFPLVSSFPSPRMEKKKALEGFTKAIRRSDAANASRRFERFYKESHLVISARGITLGKIADPTRAGPF